VRLLNIYIHKLAGLNWFFLFILAAAVGERLKPALGLLGRLRSWGATKDAADDLPSELSSGSCGRNKKTRLRRL
jgi:hypothetical protein